MSGHMRSPQLSALRGQLNRLGVGLPDEHSAPAGPGRRAEPSRATGDDSIAKAQATVASLAAVPNASRAGKAAASDEVNNLLQRIGKVEYAIEAAGATAAARQARAHKELARATSASPPRSRPSRVLQGHAMRGPKSRAKSAGGPAARRPALAPAPAAGRLPAGGLPSNTPLASILAQYKESEGAWAHEKVRLRRAADDARQRAGRADLELKKVQRLLTHKDMDAQALRSALGNRDTQLSAAAERIRSVEAAIREQQSDSALRLASLNAERDDLKALLVASLQRLEAIEAAVSHAESTGSMMADKLRGLEAERRNALDAAARARAEAAELLESRRKLQWQGRLLEKMSEVQMKHNRDKTDAIRQLLTAAADDGGGDGGGTAAW